jgi:hypothetical protein
MKEPKNKPNTFLLEEIGKSCRDEGLEIIEETARFRETAKLIPNFKQMSKTLYTLRKIDKPFKQKKQMIKI